MDTPAEVAAKRLAWQAESIKSVEIRIHGDLTLHDAAMRSQQLGTAFEEHYIETADGERFFDHRGLDGSTTTTRFTYFTDRKKCADVQYDSKNLEKQKQVTFKRQFGMEDRGDRKQLPDPLIFFYVGREPLHKALSHSQYLGETTVMDRRCDQFLFEKVRWMVPQDQVFCLDQSTSVPLQVSAYRSGEDRQQERPLWVWKAGALESVQGHSIPMRGSLAEYQGKEHALLLTTSSTVESISFGKDYPASTFWPVLEPGTNVFDTINDKFYTVPGGVSAKQSQEIATATQTNEAVPPPDWSTIVPPVTLGLGCLVLFAAAVIWWRRR